MTYEQIAAAQKRLAEATPGPWSILRKLWDDGSSSVESIGNADTVAIEGAGYFGDSFLHTTPETAEFIAHAPEDLKLALDALERVAALSLRVLERASAADSATQSEHRAFGYNLALRDLRAALTGEPH